MRPTFFVPILFAVSTFACTEDDPSDAAGGSSDAVTSSADPSTETSSADSTGPAEDPFLELVDCDEADFAPTPFIGAAFDPQTGALLQPLQPPFVVATTVGWAKPEKQHTDALGQHSTAVGEDVFTHEGLIGASFGGSEACGSARTLTIWRDEAALMGFVFGPVHAAAMTIVPQSVQAWGSTHWTETDATEAPTWDAAKARVIADH